MSQPQSAARSARSASKAKVAYVCTECGGDHSKWQGQCGECGAWNTLSEFVVEPAAGKGAAGPAARRSGWAGKADAPKVTALKDVRHTEEARVSTGIGELDRVLGGGLVEGAVMLVGGDPGIGKSTLLPAGTHALVETETKSILRHVAANSGNNLWEKGLHDIAECSHWTQTASERQC